MTEREGTFRRVINAIRLFLRSAVETGGLPVAVPRPNAKTLAAIKAAKAGKTTNATLEDFFCSPEPMQACEGVGAPLGV